jgi:hypothetical protein
MTIGESTAVLDIGGNVGALVLYAPEEMVGAEIDLVATGPSPRRTHSQVHRRTANGRSVCAAVYVALTEGRYRLSSPAGLPAEVEIRGGEVTEIDWRVPRG